MFGGTLWEEAVHDMVMENVKEAVQDVINNIYDWKIFKRAPEPDDPEKAAYEARVKWRIVLNYIQKVAEKQGKKFIVSDEVKNIVI